MPLQRLDQKFPIKTENASHLLKKIQSMKLAVD